MSFCQVNTVMFSMLPTIAILLFLVALIFSALSNLMPSRKKTLRRAAAYSLMVSVLCVGLSIVAVPVLNDIILGKPLLGCPAGTELMQPRCECGRYACAEIDPLAGQPCDSSNYTMCKFACMCSGNIGHCMRYTGSECGPTMTERGCTGDSGVACGVMC